MIVIAYAMGSGVAAFADGVADPISGGAGWGGAGLLGLVLAWLLLVRLPANDKQQEKAAERHDALVEKLATKHASDLVDTASKHAAQVKELNSEHVSRVERMILNATTEAKDRRIDYLESLKTVVAHCKEDASRTAEALKAGMDESSQVGRNLIEGLEQLRTTMFTLVTGNKIKE